MCPDDPFGAARERERFERIGQASVGVALRAAAVPGDRAAADLAKRPLIGGRGDRPVAPPERRQTDDRQQPGQRPSTMMNGRRRGSRSGPRSIHGSSARNAATTPGMTIAPTTSHLPGKVLQQLEQPEEIPLGSRDVVGIGRIGRTLERRHAAPRHRDDREEHDRDDDRVAERLVGVERERRCRASDVSDPSCPEAASARDARRSSPTSSAGRKITCAEYQRVSVSAPIVEPPWSTAAIASPAIGASREMLIVTTVAQYAR